MEEVRPFEVVERRDPQIDRNLDVELPECVYGPDGHAIVAHQDRGGRILKSDAERWTHGTDQANADYLEMTKNRADVIVDWSCTVGIRGDTTAFAHVLCDPAASSLRRGREAARDF